MKDFNATFYKEKGGKSKTPNSREAIKVLEC